MTEREATYPAHAPDMDESEDDKPVVQPASRKEPAKENREGPPVRKDPAATLEHWVPKKTRASEQKIPHF